MVEERVVSGMRPTGALHLGHFHGAIKNWIRLQSEHPCLFFVADWHALTTHYETPEVIEENVWDMVIDWLAAGIDPAQATLFIQSRIPEHAELHLLLSMITPLGWLERVPSYKDQQEKLADRDLSTYGFLGYPLLQAADVLAYRAKYVPVGEDQVPHIEMVREVARRFNHVYGREEAGQPQGQGIHGASHQVSGEGRRRSACRGAGIAREAGQPFRRRPRAPVRLPRRRRAHDPGRAGSAAHRGLEAARRGRTEDVQVLQQHPIAARGRGIGAQEDPHHADRSGAREAQRPGRPRQVPGMAIAPGLQR